MKKYSNIWGILTKRGLLFSRLACLTNSFSILLKVFITDKMLHLKAFTSLDISI